MILSIVILIIMDTDTERDNHPWIHDSSFILVNYHNYSKPNDKLSQKMQILLVVSTPPNDRLIAGFPTIKKQFRVTIVLE